MSQTKLGPLPYIDESTEIVDCHLGQYTEIGPRCRLSETEIGDYSYVAGDVEIAYTRIGKFVSIASHTRINPGNHPMDRASQHHFSYRASAYGFGGDDLDFFDWRRAHGVEIGHDAWIGHGAVILPGRRVGIGAVVGAGSIVSKDVPDYGIWIGNPGRLLRYRFEAETCDALKAIAWWDWSHQQMSAALADFRLLSAHEFCKKHSESQSPKK